LESYILETGLCGVRTGDRAWRGTYWRQGVVSYVLETGIYEVRTRDRAWEEAYTSFLWGNLSERDHLRDPDADWRIILR
jgi:hypothetical protein